MRCIFVQLAGFRAVVCPLRVPVPAPVPAPEPAPVPVPVPVPAPVPVPVPAPAPVPVPAVHQSKRTQLQAVFLFRPVSCVHIVFLSTKILMIN